MRTGGRHFLVGLCEWRRHDNIVRVVDEWLLVGRDEIRTEEVVVEPQGITTGQTPWGMDCPKFRIGCWKLSLRLTIPVPKNSRRLPASFSTELENGVVTGYPRLC